MLSDLLIAAFGILALWGLYLMVMGKSSEQLLNRDIRRLAEQNKSKAPIVYLRSFGAEGLHASDFLKAPFVGQVLPGSMAYWKDAGDMVTNVLRVIGPPIELAPPAGTWRLKPWSPSRPKQERIDNENWQQKILEWLPRAALVVVQLDATPGLKWEIAELVRRLPPIRILLVLPATQGDYDKVCASTAGLFPRPLPGKLPASRLMTFRPDWQPLPLEAKSGAKGLWYTLDPVFEQNRFEPPAWRRIYGYPERRAL